MAEFQKIYHTMPIYRSVRLEFWFPRASRMMLLKTVFLLFLLALIPVVLFLLNAYVMHTDIEAIVPYAAALFDQWKRFLGAALFFASVFWALFLVDFYFLATSRPMPFVERSINGKKKIYYLDFGGARRLYYLQSFFKKTFDLAKLYSFFRTSKFIRMLLARLSISYDSFDEFVNTKKGKMEFTEDEFILSLMREADETNSAYIGAKEAILVLFYYDKDFEQFLFAYNVHKEELTGAAEWTGNVLEESRKRGRWWEKKTLGRVQGIGKDFGFGFTYILDKYSYAIPAPLRLPGRRRRYFVHDREVFALEEILSRSGQANVLLVGEPGRGKHTILRGLAGMVQDGRVMPSLEYKRMINLDTAAISASTKTKGNFEELLIIVMNEAVRAGNIILVIDNFPEFISSAAALGVDLGSFLQPYLEGSGIQVIALANTDSFYGDLQAQRNITRLFEKVEVEKTTRRDMMRILEDAAMPLEQRFQMIITYQAIQAVYDLSDRYIADGAMPEKAISLLDRSVSNVIAKKKRVLLPDDIKMVVEEETKIPVTDPKEEETEKLLHLEEELHRQVIGQDKAIRVIADALRRLRSGLHEGKRPIGSFLFLGPTGVGKTQTAKTLAEAYFGSEKNMTRFDMSEFHGEDGMKKLIGFFETKEQGLLAMALRERPFSLLLFDEIEKSSKEVINLFLQILEEGFFTDAFGKKVSARDTIIIATSNAGSNLIWELMQTGKDPSEMQEEVIDLIRKESVFSPEILNRFDTITIFHPLSKEQLKKVAILLLSELQQRLRGKDITFTITDDLVEKIVALGYDPVMGARPMRRAINDHVEQVVAKKILEGKLTRGSTIMFSKEEVNAL